MRKAIAVLTLAIAAMTLSACSSGVEAFDREQTDADKLPAGVVDARDEDSPVIDIQSTRLLAVEDGIQYFAATARSKEGENLCLIVVPVDDSARASSGCSGGGWIGVEFPPLGVNAQLTSEFSGEREGWRMLAPNLYTRG